MSPEERDAVARARAAEVCAAYAEGETDTGELATLFGVSRRTICRDLRNGGARGEVRPKVRGYDRADVLIREGMPLIWIAEETGIPYLSLVDHAAKIPEWKGAGQEWRRVWVRIVNSEELLRLHYEFAPPSTRALKFARAA